MNILFDLTLHNTNKTVPSHGGSEYSKAVLLRLLKDKENHSVFGLYNSSYALENEILTIILKYNISLIDISDNNIYDIINENNINVFYSPSGLHFKNLDFSNKSKFKYIFTIHGIRKIALPYDLYELKYIKGIKNYVKYCYKIVFTNTYRNKYIKLYKNSIFPIDNKYIITVSEHSKSSLLTYFPSLKGSILVRLSPITTYRSNEKQINTSIFQSIHPRRYYLIVSAGIWEKNSYRAVKAFDLLHNKGLISDINLIVLGNIKKSYIREFMSNKQIIFSSYIERERLEYLYANALALIFPSLREGFGYPPIEALKYGTLTLCSGMDPMISNMENTAIYFNPLSIEDIKIKIIESLSEELYTSEMIEKRKEQYQKISIRQEQDLEKLVTLIKTPQT